MSNQYKNGDRVPSNVICARLRELSEAVTQGPAAVKREFTMRIPAELDRDADIVLADAADRIADLESLIEWTCEGDLTGELGSEGCRLHIPRQGWTDWHDNWIDALRQAKSMTDLPEPITDGELSMEVDQ